MQQTTTQDDRAFVKACGLAEDSADGHAAIDLRHELADYGRLVDKRLMTEAICAGTRIADSGILHPADSIDLVEFTEHVEDLLGNELSEGDIRALLAAGREEMTVKDWIQLVLDMRKRR